MPASEGKWLISFASGNQTQGRPGISSLPPIFEVCKQLCPESDCICNRQKPFQHSNSACAKVCVSPSIGKWLAHTHLVQVRRMGFELMNWTWMHKPGFCPEKGYDLTYTALGQHNVLEVSPYAVFCCCCYFSHNSNFSQIASLLSLPISFTSRNSGLLPKPGSCEILSTGSYILKSLDRKVNQGAIQCLSFLNSGR